MKESKTLVSLAIGGLAIVNIALAVVLWTRSWEPAAYAQAGGRDDVIAISCRNTQTGPGTILMLDTSSGILAIMRPDNNGRIVRLLDRHDVAADMAKAK